MRKISFFFAVLILCASSFGAQKYAGFKLIGYIPTWNSGLNGDPTSTNERDINKIDFSKITHAIASFINSDANGNLVPIEWTASPWSHEQALDTIVARSKRNGVKVLISLGSTQDGWEMTKSAAARTNFAKQIKQYLISHDFDGLDLDLEGGWDESSPFYSKEYALLAKELRDSLGGDFYLTSAVGATNDKLWTKDFLSALDWINIMIYDLHMWERKDVRNDSGFDDQIAAAKTWSKRLPKEKLVLGAPFYGHGWDYDKNERLSYEINWWHPANQTDTSKWNWYPSDYFHYFVLDSLFDLSPSQDSVLIAKDDKLWFDVENSDMAFRRAKSNAIIYFNGQNLLKKKAKWAIDSGYGGMMIWELMNDVPASYPNSLLNALAKQFSESTKDMPSSTNAQSIKSTEGVSFLIQNKTLKISLPNAKNAKITVADSRGRLIFSKTTNAKEIFVSLENKRFADGIYLLSVRQDGTVKSTNFLLKN
jgi:GH18 family chitinase